MEAKFNHSVLIVDDEEPVCRAVARLLRRMEVVAGKGPGTDT